MKGLISVAALAVFFGLADGVGLGARAQTPHCVPVQHMPDHEKQWGQQLVETQLRPVPDNPNKLIVWELWHNPENDHWALTGKDGSFACLVLAGWVWEEGRTIDTFFGPIKPKGTAL